MIEVEMVFKLSFIITYSFIDIFIENCRYLIENTLYVYIPAYVG